MRVNLKTLGLALVAAFALSAVAVSSASAQEVKFTADSYPAVMTGHEEGEKTTNNFFRGTDGAILTCETATFESTLKEASTSLTVTPHYAGCRSHRGPNHETTNSLTVHLNGCHYEFHAKNEHSDNETTVPGTADVVCPDGSPGIVITIATCTVHIPAQTGLTGITFTNEPADGTTPDPWVTIDVAIENQIKYTDTDGFLCPFQGDSTNANGDLFATVVAKGYEDVENVSHPTTGGNGVEAYKHGESLGIDVKTTTE